MANPSSATAVTILDDVLAAVRTWPSAHAVRDSQRSLAYQQLWGEAGGVARAIRVAGCPARGRVVLGLSPMRSTPLERGTSGPDMSKPCSWTWTASSATGLVMGALVREQASGLPDGAIRRLDYGRDFMLANLCTDRPSTRP